MTDITKLIVQTLHKAFSDCEIYTETIPQGFRQPCFSVLQIDGSAQEYPNERIFLSMNFDVRFFPEKRQQCREMAVSLTALLRTLPGLCGRDISWQITDNVLHFFVTYEQILQETEAAVAMEILTISTGGKA